MLAKWVLNSLSHTSSPFYFGYFGDGVSNYLPALVSDHDPPISAPQVARNTGISHRHVARVASFLKYSFLVLVFPGFVYELS
jgi:predicted AAA+ superfamily ATPase